MAAQGAASLEHEKKRLQLTAELAAARASGGTVRLGKSTSNLFRHRNGGRSGRIDVRHFNQVLHVDREKRLAEVEGMTTYEAFVDATLREGMLPAVVPQLKTITVGGAVSGVGIESSSFRYGLVHETVEEMDILLGDGSIVTCSRESNPDLFFGFPNSYGTLGYALRLKVRLIPAGRYVRLTHERYYDPESYFDRIGDLCRAEKKVDYLDGSVFSPNEMYVTTGELADVTTEVSNYTYMGIYYKSIRQKREDWLSARDYIWRWDTDWFWCSKQFGVQHPIVRFLATKWTLNSRNYQRVMRLAAKLMPASNQTESVIQDVDIPIEQAPEFFNFLMAEIGIKPVWVCPFQAFDRAVTYDLYAIEAGKVHINFGFWDIVPSSYEPGHFNRKVERKMIELGGKKGLYSTSWFDRETFWRIYNRDSYEVLKRKYDPTGAFLDLYEKCVQSK